MLGLLAALALLAWPAAGQERASAPGQPAALMSVRAWTPPPGQDDFAQARAALDAMATAAERASAASARRGTAPMGFDLRSSQAVWYALQWREGDVPLPLVLELSHLSVRQADLYLPGTGEPTVLHGGRDVPVEQRADQRFPATFELAPSAMAGTTRTAYLRLVSQVPARGTFVLQPRSVWASQVADTRLVQAGGAIVSLIAALYAGVSALLRRSAAWSLYFLLCVALLATRVFVSGYAEDWLWPELGAQRGALATLSACFAAGVALLLFRSAFTLDVRAPAYSRALLVLGVACPIAGVAAQAFGSAAQQATAQAAGTISVVMGLSSIVLAWRTANRVAQWLMAGFAPVAFAALAVNLGTSGILPFGSWILLVTPLTTLVEVPFNLRGLHLLERRRSQVIEHRAHVGGDAGPANESRNALAVRFAGALQAIEHPPATVMLLRLQGMAPGSATLRDMDAVGVERYVHSLMRTVLRAGNEAGRWSFNELALLRIHLQATSGVSGLVTALFAHALRSDDFGLRPRDVDLRIAYARFDAREMSAAEALARLSTALDDPDWAGQRRIEVDLMRHQVVRRRVRASAPQWAHADRADHE